MKSIVVENNENIINQIIKQHEDENFKFVSMSNVGVNKDKIRLTFELKPILENEDKNDSKN